MEGNQYHVLLTVMILTRNQLFHLKPGETFVLGIVSRCAVEFWRSGGTTAGNEITSFVLGVPQVSCLTRFFQNLLYPSKSRQLMTYLKQSLTGAMEASMATKFSHC